MKTLTTDVGEIWNCGFCGAPAYLTPNHKGVDFFVINDRGCSCREIEYRRGNSVYRKVRGHSLSPRKG